jgi:hypothetical protein
MDYLGKYENKGWTESLVIPLSDETTSLTTGDEVYTFYLPYDLTILKMYLSINEASVGQAVKVDVLKNDVSMFTTVGSFKVTQNLNVSSAQPDFSALTYFAAGSKMSFNIDQVGNTNAGAGLKCMIIGHRTVETEL